MTLQTLLVTSEGNITTITLNRPTKLNALNSLMLDELEMVFGELMADESRRCLILTGSGDKAFAAGADIAELREKAVQSGPEFAKRGQKVCALIEEFPIPVIAAVNGFALGGGCELALACHVRIAAESAKFGLPEVKLGILPGYGGTQRLTVLCGPAVATELICSGETINAERALSIGLVNRVVPGDALLAECQKLAQSIASVGSLAVRGARRCIRVASTIAPEAFEKEAEEFGLLCSTRDFDEGTLAFLEKRPPHFHGS